MKQSLKHFFIACFAAALVGCTSVARFTLDTEFDSSPTKTKTKLTAALQCLSTQLERNRSHSGAYAFMVRDIRDGTVNASPYSDGPLADAGRIQLISILSAHTKPGYGVVLDEFPVMLKPVVNEQVGLNRFGLPSPNNLNNFVSHLTRFANANRQASGMPVIAEVMPLTIDGAFTRYDSSHIRSKGYGQNLGYRGDVTDEESASVDFGDSGSERSVTLVVNIIDPRNNVVVGTEGFDLKFFSNSKTARFRVAIDEYYYGFSNTNVRVETVHAAQQILLEASAIWILDNAYGNLVDFSSCFDSEERIALGQDARFTRYEQAKDSALVVPLTPETGGAVPDTAAAQKAVVPTAKETVAKETAAKETAAKEAVAKETVAMSKWRVGAGIFCKPSNAKRLLAKLRKRGYNAHSRPIKMTVCKGATLVYLSPFRDRTTAELRANALTPFTGEKGYVHND